MASASARKDQISASEAPRSPGVAVSDQDGAGRPARLGAAEHRVGKQPSAPDPADSDDGMRNEAVPVAHVWDEGRVLPAGAENVSCDPVS